MDFIIQKNYSIIPVQQNSKATILRGWTTFDKEQGNELALKTVEEGGNYGVRLGKIGGLVVVDVDKPWNESDQFFVKQARKEAHMSTRTPHGNHYYFRYDERFDGMTRFRIGYVDILANNTYAVGPGSRVNGIEYLLERDGHPERMSDELFEEIMRLRLSSTRSVDAPEAFQVAPFGRALQVEVANNQEQNEEDMSGKINEIMGLDCAWTVVSLDNGAYKLTPKTRACLVKTLRTQPGLGDILHSREEHSCLMVYKTAVVAQCFSHNKLSITGIVSSRLRSLFFDTNPVERIISAMLAKAKKERLVRKDGYVWERDESIPHLFKKMGKVQEFVAEATEGDEAIIKKPSILKEINYFMESAYHKDFPMIKPDKRYLGFRNGVLDLEKENFIPVEESTSVVFPRHYIDQDYNEESMDTPLFDSLVKFQLPSEAYPYLLAFIGRLFYDVGEKDEWQIAPLIKGDSGTGKSTILGIISAMFSSDRIGSIGSNLERTFGLQSSYDKEIVLIHELSDEMSSRLGSDLFKKMICGEEVSVPIKNKPAETVNWSAPIFMCGNAHLSYEDAEGSISRRIAIFKFDNYVEKKDSFIKSRIVKEELAKLISKCICAYGYLRRKMGNKSFWEICPEYFHDNTDEAKQETDYLYRFLTRDPDDNKWGSAGIYHRLYFRKKKGSSMLLEDFKTKFKNYMKYKHPEVKYKWTSDYSSFKRLGYDVKYAHTCKACMSTTGKGCCEEYNSANRSRRYVIEDMECVEE